MKKISSKNLIFFGLALFAVSAIGYTLTTTTHTADTNLKPEVQHQASIEAVVLRSELNSPGGDAVTEADAEFSTGSLNGVSGPVSSDRTSGEVSISAQKAMVANLLTGETFFSKQDSSRWPMASIVKLMSAYIASHVIGPKNIIQFEASDFDLVDSWHPDLAEGQSYIAEDMMKALLLPSSNETAEAFARTYGRERFIDELNIQASRWGLHSTHFTDPSGLSVGNQSTASDLRIMAKMIYEESPEIFAITRMPTAIIEDINSKKKITVKSTNAFAGNANFLGGKTGFTTEAKGNLLSIFEHQGVPIFIVVMGSTDRFGDTQRLFNLFINDISSSN